MSMFQFPHVGYGNAEQLVLSAETLSTWKSSQCQIAPKDVLRQAIHKNIRRKGHDLPVIEKFQVVRRRPKQPISGDVPEEVLRRREKNRKAAMKCREKKRKNIDKLQERVDKYENRNRELEKEIQSFKEEKDELKKLLYGHSCCKKRQKITLHNHHHDNPFLFQVPCNVNGNQLFQTTQNINSLTQTLGNLEEGQQPNSFQEDGDISIAELLKDLDEVWQ